MIGGKYAKVYTRLWTDPAFRAWSDDARFTAVYLLTCPHRNTEGLFRLPMAYVLHDLGWPEERLVAALAELDAAGFIARDPAADLIWLREVLAADPPAGGNQVKGAVRALADVPESPLRGEYLADARTACPELAKALEADLGWVETADSDPCEAPSKGFQEAPSKGLPPVDNSPSNAQAQSHPQAHAQTQGTDPRETRDGPPPDPRGGGGDDPTDAQLIGRADALLGLANPPPPTPGDLRTVAAARRRGWTDEHFVDVARQAADPARNIDRPRAWLRAAWARMANEDPPDDPERLGTPIGPARTVDYQRVHPEDCPGRCSREGWITSPTGMTQCTGHPIDTEATA